ncbi:hypothetical protein ACSBR1_006885 [Camellia fascicularis]
MGSCVSVHKNSHSVQSSIKKNTLNNEQIEPQSSSLANVSTFGDLGSKEEKFFDSQLWLESDSEDFFSINGGKITLIFRYNNFARKHTTLH